jgi:branched-chain amino acid transport system permease protein
LATVSGGLVLQLTLDSLAAAAVYATLGLAIHAAHAGSGVLHLAAGDVAMVGAVAGAALAARGAPVAVAVALALLLGAAASAALERGVVAPAGGRPVLAAAGLVAAGALLRQGMSALFPRAAYPFPAPAQVWRLGDGVVRASDLVTVAVVAVVAAGAAAVISRTRFGAALRVTAASPGAAEDIGVDTSRLRLAAFAAAGALAALGAVLASARVAPAPAAGVPLALRAVAAAAAGGLASPLSVGAGALLVGGVEVGAGYALGGWGEPVTDAVAVLVVALRWRR